VVQDSEADVQGDAAGCRWLEAPEPQLERCVQQPGWDMIVIHAQARERPRMHVCLALLHLHVYLPPSPTLEPLLAPCSRRRAKARACRLPPAERARFIWLLLLLASLKLAAASSRDATPGVSLAAPRRLRFAAVHRLCAARPHAMAHSRRMRMRARMAAAHTRACVCAPGRLPGCALQPAAGPAAHAVHRAPMQ
jgi:hypothetical protein